MHIRDEILCRLLNLQLIVRHYHKCLDQLGEVVVTKAHVLDGKPLTEFQDQLLVPIDEVILPVISLQRQHLRFDVDLNGCPVDIEFEGEKDRFVLELEVETGHFVETLVQKSFMGSIFVYPFASCLIDNS